MYVEGRAKTRGNKIEQLQNKQGCFSLHFALPNGHRTTKRVKSNEKREQPLEPSPSFHFLCASFRPFPTAGVLRAASPYSRDPSALLRSCSACFAGPTAANSPCLRCAAAAWRLHPHAACPLCALAAPLMCAFSSLTMPGWDPVQLAHRRRRLLPLHVFRVFLGHFCSFRPENRIFELPVVVSAWCRRLAPSICCSRGDGAQQRRARGGKRREQQRGEVAGSGHVFMSIRSLWSPLEPSGGLLSACEVLCSTLLGSEE